MKTSNCCGAEPVSNGDTDTEDYGICPECKEHCEYIDEEEREKREDMAVNRAISKAEGRER